MKTAIHLIACDLCGTEVEVKKNYLSSIGDSPEGWFSVSAYQERKLLASKESAPRISIFLEVCPVCFGKKAAKFFEGLLLAKVTVERVPEMVDNPLKDLIDRLNQAGEE